MPYTKKTIDFKNAVCHALNMKGREFDACLTYNVEQHKLQGNKQQEYWSVTFADKSRNISLSSYSDVNFCFNCQNAKTRSDEPNKYLYTTKKHALLHLQLQMILLYRPTLLRSWMTFNNKSVPHIIDPLHYEKKKEIRQRFMPTSENQSI